MHEFADYCRNGLLNTEYSIDNIDSILKEWELMMESRSGRIIEDGFGGRWSAICPNCKQSKMQIVRPGKVKCSKCG